MTRPQDPEFLIYAPPYDPAVGGSVVLHSLCARLNALGYSAAIWPWAKPPALRIGDWRSWRRHLGYRLRLRFLATRRQPFENPVGRAGQVETAIALYPEVIDGNPLGSPFVVRWLLHRPGYHTGQFDYGEDEIFFFYNPAFIDPALDIRAENILRIEHVPECYRQTNFGDREDTCYAVRKGAGRVLDRHPADAILIDDMAHEEIAATFNRSEAFYTYDSYTYYTELAAICGCIPIVIPEPEVTKEEWEPRPEGRLGRAYGIDDIPWAIATRDALLRQIEERQVEEDRQVHAFVETCRRQFGRAARTVGREPL